MSTHAQTLRKLPSVRERCTAIYELAQKGQIDSFTLDESRYEAVIEKCAETINVGSREGRIGGFCKLII